MKIRWCETHDCQHLLKDACSRRVIALGDGLTGRGDGCVNLGEQMDGPQECVEIWKHLYDENPIIAVAAKLVREFNPPAQLQLNEKAAWRDGLYHAHDMFMDAVEDD